MLYDDAMAPIIENNLEAIHALCRRFEVAKLEIFGSAAGESFDPQHSDVDLLVSFAASPTMNRAQQYFGLLAELEKLFGRKVDLLMPRGLRNRYLIRSIDSTRRQLYAA
jgi:uncharacterized protein